MALIICPLCGGQLSDKAKKCPHCSAPMNMILPLLETQSPVDNSNNEDSINKRVEYDTEPELTPSDDDKVDEITTTYHDSAVPTQETLEETKESSLSTPSAKKGNKKTLVFSLLGFVMVLAIGILLFICGAFGDKSPSQNDFYSNVENELMANTETSNIGTKVIGQELYDYSWATTINGDLVSFMFDSEKGLYEYHREGNENETSLGHFEIKDNLIVLNKDAFNEKDQIIINNDGSLSYHAYNLKKCEKKSYFDDLYRANPDEDSGNTEESLALLYGYWYDSYHHQMMYFDKGRNYFIANNINSPDEDYVIFDKKGTYKVDGSSLYFDTVDDPAYIITEGLLNNGSPEGDGFIKIDYTGNAITKPEYNFSGFMSNGNKQYEIEMTLYQITRNQYGGFYRYMSQPSDRRLKIEGEKTEDKNYSLFANEGKERFELVIDDNSASGKWYMYVDADDCKEKNGNYTGSMDVLLEVSFAK